MKSVKSYFDLAIKEKASDIHLIGGEKPSVRIDGELVEVEEPVLPDKNLREDLMAFMNAEQKNKFEENKELDMSVTHDGARFRVNIHQQMGKIGMAARLIPEVIPSPEELRFEPALLDFTNLLDGLILVVGPTGCGKSTTIASMIEEINKTRKSHIVTVEDPIEFVFQDKESLIEQREVGVDTNSFASALKHVLRQDPNVILVGEMRDPETIATVLTAAETGHLVFSTLHTSTAAEAIERIIDVFDGSKQKQILIQLGAVLRGVIAQQLIPATNGKLVSAREILINTPAVANLIKENNIPQIHSAIQTGAKIGMISMENSVKQLLKEDLIDKETSEHRIGRARKV
jgi:twitching motility protein PilT